MKARQRQVFTFAGGLFAGLVAAGAPFTLEAQRNQTPDPNAPRLMVPTLRSTDKGLGVEAADAIRNRLTRDISTKSLWLIPKNDIMGTLEASGYPKDEALAPNDARELGKLLRADEYLQGTVTKTPAGHRIESQLVLVRDNALAQPLPPVEAGKLDQAASQLSKEIQNARKQMDDERKCVQLAREGKYAEAIAAAQAGVAKYPQATLVRICALSARQAMKAPNDTLVKAAEEILAIDPRSRPALAVAAQSYTDMAKAATDSVRRDSLQDRALATWTDLLATDPTNTRLVDNVVREIAASGRPQVALPIIQKAVEANPGDPQLTRLQWRIQLAARDMKGAIASGEQLVQLDTAMADTLYFIGQASAYQADSQPQKAAEVLARGIQKFPDNPNLQLIYAQQLRQTGQTPQAIEAYRKVLATNPKIERGFILLAQAQMDANQPDSALASLRQAATAGDSLAGPFALSLGNQLYKTANGSKKREDFQQAMKFLAVSDSLAPSKQAKFLLGASAFSVGLSAAQDAPKAKSCELAQLAQESFNTAQINVPQGAEIAPDAAQQIMGAVQQYSPVIDKQVKGLCKGARASRAGR